MEYTKPEVVVLANAISAIQGSKIGGPVDQPDSLTVKTTSAYEADE
jgi:hypothetical protein